MKEKLSLIIKEKGAYFLTEYFIVVVGILSAFALNAWWESKKAQQRESAYFSQIQNEIERADQGFKRYVEGLEDNFRAVKHVYESLEDGEIIGGDVELFDQGLLRADVLPAMRYPVPTYRELRITGVFTELSDETLKDMLSELDRAFDFAVAHLEYFRAGLQSAKSELNRSVKFSIQEPDDDSSSWYKVSYDFEKLAANELLQNEFVEVIDSHYDWLRLVQQMHSSIETYRKTSEQTGT